jgi:hypothetical protein
MAEQRLYKPEALLLGNKEINASLFKAAASTME